MNQEAEMDNQMKRTLVGIYHDAAGAKQAIDELIGAGYERREISVISRAVNDDRDKIEGMETLEDAVTNRGTLPVEAIGGVSGLLASLGLLNVPGLGEVMAAGPLKDRLTGNWTAGPSSPQHGLTIGEVICGPNAPKGERDFADLRFKAGDIFVTVDAPGDRFDRTAEIFGADKAVEEDGIEGSAAHDQRDSMLKGPGGDGSADAPLMEEPFDNFSSVSKRPGAGAAVPDGEELGTDYEDQARDITGDPNLGAEQNEEWLRDTDRRRSGIPRPEGPIKEEDKSGIVAGIELDETDGGLSYQDGSEGHEGELKDPEEEAGNILDDGLKR